MRRLLAITLLASTFGIAHAQAATTPEQRQECRFRGVRKHEAWEDYAIKRTIRCSTRAIGGSVTHNMSTINCESGFEPHQERSATHHGPAQYLTSTYQSQRRQLPAIRHHWELSRSVYSVRSNVIMFVAWVYKRSYSPWSCA